MVSRTDQRGDMPETEPRTVTVTFALSVDPGADAPDATDIAVYLDGLLAASDAREPGPYSLSEPTVFTEPVAVVLNLTGGCLESAEAEIPLCVVGVDYGASRDDCNCFIPQGVDEADAEVEAHRIEAEVRPDWVADVLERVNAARTSGERDAGGMELRPDSGPGLD